MTSQLKFEVAGQTPLWIRNRDVGNTQLHDLGQLVGRSEGDQVYVYDTRLSRDDYELTITEITRLEKDRFMDFFDDAAKGSTNAFTLTIPALDAGASPTTLTNARFAEGRLPLVEDFEGRFSITVTVFTQSEGPTGPPT